MAENTETQASLEDWIVEHGAAAAIAGCFVFWLVVGLTAYFKLRGL